MQTTTISIDTNAAETHSENISTDAGDLILEQLVNCDGKSTITANQKSQTRYKDAKSANDSIQEALVKEAKVIGELGLEFKNLNTKAGQLAEMEGN